MSTEQIEGWNEHADRHVRLFTQYQNPHRDRSGMWR